jgi:glutathione synthase/RimK-type ligase-like ATP-grasp enzyme
LRKQRYALVDIACFVETYNFLDRGEAEALLKFKHVANSMGHNFDFIFKKNLSHIPLYDALFIRAVTDPSYSSYIASKIAWENKLRVIDDPHSIQVCSNKIHMYKLLERFGVPYIPSIYLVKGDLDHKTISKVLQFLGSPVVIKAPYTSFSKYVEKTGSEIGFRKICKRFFRRSDIVVVQKFMPTSFDWRVGVLDGEVLFVCKYFMPKGRWKHITRLRRSGRIVYGEVEPLPRDEAPLRLKYVAVSACKAIGPGLFGVDIKEIDDEYFVVEVNDNPSIYAGSEDRVDCDVYRRIIEYLAK